MKKNKPSLNKYQGVTKNNQIRSPKVRIVGDGESGIVDTKSAIQFAQNQGMDLIVINDKGEVPVCRVMDANKFLYEQQQKDKAQRKKQRENAVEQKEIRMSLNIGDGDIQVKCNNIRKMLEKNCKVTLTVSLKGRERGKQDLARDLLNKFADILQVELEGFSQTGNKVMAKIK